MKHWAGGGDQGLFLVGELPAAGDPRAFSGIAERNGSAGSVTLFPFLDEGLDLVNALTLREQFSDFGPLLLRKTLA